MQRKIGRSSGVVPGRCPLPNEHTSSTCGHTPTNGDKPTPLPPLSIVRPGLHPPRPCPNISSPAPTPPKYFVQMPQPAPWFWVLLVPILKQSNPGAFQRALTAPRTCRLALLNASASEPRITLLSLDLQVIVLGEEQNLVKDG